MDINELFKKILYGEDGVPEVSEELREARRQRIQEIINCREDQKKVKEELLRVLLPEKGFPKLHSFGNFGVAMLYMGFLPSVTLPSQSVQVEGAYWPHLRTLAEIGFEEVFKAVQAHLKAMTPSQMEEFIRKG